MSIKPQAGFPHEFDEQTFDQPLAGKVACQAMSHTMETTFGKCLGKFYIHFYHMATASHLLCPSPGGFPSLGGGRSFRGVIRSIFLGF